MATDFTLPELGENVTAGDVLRILVKPGDALSKDQPVLELETDKATIEVPSSVAGQVRDIKVKVGEKVKVGQAILTVDGGEAAAGKPAAAPQSAPAQAAAAPQPTASTPRDGSGGQPPADAVDEEPAPEPPVAGNRRQAPDKSGAIESGQAAPAPSAPSSKVVDISRGTRSAAEPVLPDQPIAPAAPSVRRMARELGVDINQVAGSGPNGRISTDDVKAYAKRIVTEMTSGAAAQGAAFAAEPLPDFTRWGEVDRQPMRAVRRKTAEHLSAAWATIPHVTQHDLADITAIEELRKRYAKPVEAAGGNLTVTAIAVKVVAAALNVFPKFNASIDMAASELVFKKFVNIGVAVDTDRGLLVPVIRNADKKNITQISVELSQLSEKARSRKISLDEMQGGCFSISNLGGIGGTAFSPIVNAPEVAILGISRARMEPVYDKPSGQFQPRLMLPLSLSYDHRVIDGADGIRFLRWVVEAFEQPFVLALNG
ncbi:MAG TPA: 2-oxo acid dehydrogenase subunit E2 [Vicinamibacterales bacterium]